MKNIPSALRFILSFAGGAMLGIAVVASGAASRGSVFFPDVPSGSYFDEAVGEMYDLGVVKGYETGKFGPNDFVTRGQVAVMMKRLRDEIKGISESTSQQSPSRDSSSNDDDDDMPSTPVVSAPKNPAGFLRFTIDKYTVDENVDRATISVIRTGGTKGAVTVKYAVTDGTAKAGEDYEAATGELRFGDGESSKTFAVAIKDDALSEGNETIILTLSDVSGGASLGTPINATLTIDDNEKAPTTSSGGSGGGNSGGGSSNVSGSSSADAGTLGFSSQAYSIGENTASVTITVERTSGSKGAVSVSYATKDGTAVAPTDYTATNGNLSFADGEKSKTFSIAIIDDSLTEGNKKLNLILSNPTGGAKLAELATVELTIADDEVVAFGPGSIRFSKDSYIAREKGGSVTITIERIGGAKGTATVKYATRDGNAKFGVDYVKTEGTMTFLEGETKKSFVVAIIEDTVNDPDEKIYLDLSEVTGATIGSPEESEITIQQ